MLSITLVCQTLSGLSIVFYGVDQNWAKKALASPLQNHLRKRQGGTGFKGKQEGRGWSVEQAEIMHSKRDLLELQSLGLNHRLVGITNMVSFAG